ncbi:MAG: RagB/SusD family nutrient uptake outer membrane protein [Bacteroidetes bacterium]|nr:RagB/SusD family nutrient uptake outer membrane protein [Bacteroidota bacterium]MCL5737092.1 RagB/SusD family nutrient uptake outer membrane protein [Bacteroidota bacterium]
MKKKSCFMGIIVVASGLLSISGCSLNVNDPNSATNQQVLTNPSGIMALAIGLQQFYSTSALGAIILTPGVTARELAINTTLENLVELEGGGSQLLNNNANVTALWSNLYQVIEMSDELISNVPGVSLDPGTRSGILAEAYLFKAMALGNLAQDFEQEPMDVDASGNAKFVPRTDVLAEAISLLDTASQIIAATPPSSQFKSQVLGSGFDLPNTIQAYRARYSLFAGRYQDAITAANGVNPMATSVFSYSSLSQNPIYQAVFILKRYAARDSFGTPLTEPGDQRLSFYLRPDSAFSTPNKYPIDILVGFFSNATQPIPAYLPGEMHLIKAEAYVRLGDLASAVNEINAVRTEKPSQDPYGIGASLPDYNGPMTSDSLLTEVYRQRCAELYLEGMRFEDSRRLGRPSPPANTVERNRNFYPYPLQERINNPNTPPDPAD